MNSRKSGKPSRMDSLCVLVTGAGGYIGSHTVLELIRAGVGSIVAIDNFVNCSGNAKPDALERIEKLTGKSVVFYAVDVCDVAALHNVFQKHKVDCVIHLAALKAVGESCRYPLKYYQNNVNGTVTVLETMANNNVKKLVFSSSATVYGIPEFLPLTETHSTGRNCTSPYGRSKYFIEEILKDLCAIDKDWGVLSLRYFNPVGADESGVIGEDPNDVPNNLMPLISQVAVGRRDKIFVLGNDYKTRDGTGVRDYIHITDLSIGHVAALNKLMFNHADNSIGFQAINLGTGKSHTVLEVIETFREVSGQDITYEITKRREGDIDALYADASLAKKELNWTAKFDLQKMCQDTWNWQKNNCFGYKNN